MNKQNQIRLILISFLILGCVVGVSMAAVPQSTLRTTGGGITTYVGHFGNFTLGIFQGATERLSAIGEATFFTVDADQYFLSTVNKTDIFAYPETPVAYTVFTDGTNVYAQNGTTGIVDYTNADARTVINQALAALPINGGEVRIKNGNYTISQDGTNVYGIHVVTDNTILSGEGWGTNLTLEAGSSRCNVIRIGNGTDNVFIRDLYIDGNMLNITAGAGFESCGVRAGTPDPGSNRCNNIVVENCHIRNCGRLNVMLIGSYNYVRNNYLYVGPGVLTNDIVELLIGPGKIEGNYVLVDGTAWYGLGVDSADDVTIQNNYIDIQGEITNVFRLWTLKYRNKVLDNTVYCDNDGGMTNLVVAAGRQEEVKGNFFYYGWSPFPDVVVTGSGLIMTGNTFYFCGDLTVTDDGTNLPTLITENLWDYGNVAITLNAGVYKFFDNWFTGNPTVTLGAGTYEVYRNIGYATENSGLGTLYNLTSSVTVAHGLDYTPTADEFSITFTSSLANVTQWWISGIGAANFDLNVGDAGVAKLTSTNITFGWAIDRHD